MLPLIAGYDRNNPALISLSSLNILRENLVTARRFRASVLGPDLNSGYGKSSSINGSSL